MFQPGMTQFTRRIAASVIGPSTLPPDPPFAVDERETLVTFLDYYRSYCSARRPA